MIDRMESEGEQNVNYSPTYDETMTTHTPHQGGFLLLWFMVYCRKSTRGYPQAG